MNIHVVSSVQVLVQQIYILIKIIEYLTLNLFFSSIFKNIKEKHAHSSRNKERDSEQTPSTCGKVMK